ncbi:hypothetical protein GF312_07900 [Candidatus Poribacteria bacterium]|nr:hypothetical protein [Candidatus Poribacteria bacterium]
MEKERLRLLSIDMENYIKNIDDIYDKIIQRNEIDTERLMILINKALKLRTKYKNDVESFLQALSD